MNVSDIFNSLFYTQLLVVSFLLLLLFFLNFSLCLFAPKSFSSQVKMKISIKQQKKKISAAFVLKTQMISCCYLFLEVETKQKWVDRNWPHIRVWVCGCVLACVQSWFSLGRMQMCLMTSSFPLLWLFKRAMQKSAGGPWTRISVFIRRC